MTVRKFIIKTIVKIVIFIVFMVVVTSFVGSISPLVTNDIALTQMQNYDDSFVLMNTYNKIRPIFNLVYAGIIIWFTSSVARDTYKFVKNIKK